jgi:serine/threonine protein kinase
MVQYELCMGKHPFSAQNEGALIRKIMRGDFERPTGYSRELLGVVMACLTFQHKSRPSAKTLLARPAVHKKAHDLHILPLSPAQRPGLPQPTAEPRILPASGHGPTAATVDAERNPLVEMPELVHGHVKHPFAREGSTKEVSMRRLVDCAMLEAPP